MTGTHTLHAQADNNNTRDSARTHCMRRPSTCSALPSALSNCCIRDAADGNASDCGRAARVAVSLVEQLHADVWSSATLMVPTAARGVSRRRALDSTPLAAELTEPPAWAADSAALLPRQR